MSRKYFGSRSSADRPYIVPQPRRHRPVARRSLLFSFLLTLLLLLSEVVGNWGFLAKPVEAAGAGRRPSAPASMTMQQFLKEGRNDRVYHGPLIRPQKTHALPSATRGHFADYGHLPPSAELARMKPIAQALAPTFLQGGAGLKSLDLRGSDGRLQVLIAPGAFDLSKATVAGGSAPLGSITLRLSQLSGHFVGMLSQLGTYQVQLLDSQGKVLSGIRLRSPITFIYHYQPAELASLGLDPSHLFLTWPALLAAAQKRHAPTTGYSIPLFNDAAAHTLTGQSSVLDSQIVNVGVSDPGNQSPAALHLASVQGNAGQLSYSYPLQLAPGSGGFTPQLALTYSSSVANERHSLTSPANNVGDGWNLSLGSISTEISGSTTWYFLNDVDNVGDRLIPIGTTNFFDTQHISYLKIQIVNPTSPTPCFHLWDKSGAYYEVGCTADSLEYWTDSGGGRHNYQWNVSKIVSPNEGASAGTYKMTLVKYLQDSVTSGGYTTIRDSAIEQITYGVTTSLSNPLSTVAGTVDFHYLAPTAQGSWADAYNYGTNYNCAPGTTQPVGHPGNQRCDDPVQMSGSGTFTAPTVLSTLTLAYVTSYVGDDSSSSHQDYRYAFTYNDYPYVSCTDPTSGLAGYCAGEHLLMSATPTVYQNGTSHQLKGMVFGYTTGQHDTYTDLSQTVGGQPYQVTTAWQYLNSYRDTNTGVGAQISYSMAYNNTHGTPTQKDGSGSIIDDRYDPFYCVNHQGDPTLGCNGNWAHPDDRAWSEQVVTAIKAWSLDSSSSSLQQAETSYFYRLAKTGTYSGTGTFCSPDQYNQDQDCVGDNWIPAGDTDWQDYYHAEYQGFAQVYITSPANDLTVDSYYDTEGWNSPWSDPQNFLGGSLQEEDVYGGNNPNSQSLLQSTVNTYAANANACRSTTATYPACEVFMQSTKTTDDEQASSSTAPWVEHDYTYDDYSTSGGLVASGVYHNLTQEVISGSNLSTTLYPVTNKWTYTPNDQTVGSWTYYTVNAVTHRETDDHNGGVWQCQDTAYDEDSGNSKPTAGWPTTSTSYSTACQSGTAIKLYQGYDAYGNALAAVDGVGAANPAFYNSTGCTPTTGNTITIHTDAWTNTHYTSCANYDAAHFYALPVSTGNALGQSASIAYDATQGDVPTSTINLNGQTTSYTYSYDSSGNRTVQDTEPLNSGSYTTQSKTNSSCTTSSTLPCYEIDTNTNQYSGAITRTFYDGMGRAVETRKPGPGANYDTIVFTVYNDQAHTSFQSVPFQVASGSGWVDPNGITDYQGTIPGGTVTFYDALDRAVAEQDPNYGSSQEPGIACALHLSGTYTDCVNEWLGTAAGDTNTYSSTTMVDANNHVTKSYADALGRTVYIQYYSGLNGQTLTSNEQKSTQYNALDKPTSMVVTDKASQSGQSVTSVTTSAQYDSLGRLTQVNDPDRGTHTYSYDADGRLLSDVVGTHTLGYNDDLLGRIGCVQDAVPTLNATGACSAGKTYVQNTYDTTELGTQGSSDFPLGHLTQSVATTYYPEGTSATTTQKFQYDKRGRGITAQLSLGLPSAWNVTTALPTYQQASSYNDADQVTTTTTSTTPSGQGYTTTMAYDSSGAPYGLSNNSSSTPNLATLVYNARAQLDTINMQTSTGSALAADQFSYDANLRLTSMTTSWQSGSGNTGTIFAESNSYDNAGNVISLSTTQAAVPGFSGSGGSETQNFCYDEQNQLVWAGNSGTQPAAGNGTCGSGTLASGLTGGSYSNSYVYTHLGQLWQGPLSGGSTQYQYLYCASSQPHQLSGLYPLGTTCSNQSGAVYNSSDDAFGNVTSRTYKGTTATLSYDNLNHFTEWNAGATSQEWYVYDGAGQRVLRRSTDGSTTSLTVYAFGREEHSYTSTGTNQGNTYYYTLAGHLLGKSDGGSTTFYQTDLLGSVVADFSNTAGSAAIKGNEVYGPYGKQRYNQGTHGTPKGFTGQYNDSLTGLDYYNARYYDPVVGVFLSADTVQGNGSGMNPYGYVGGNPETLNDPSGERFAPPPCGPAGCYGSVGSAGGGGAGTAPPVWRGYLQPFLTGTTGTSIMTHGVTDVTNLSPCGGFSIADCLKANWAAQTQVQGYVVVSRPFSGGITGGQPVCLGMGLMSMCTSMPGSSTGINVPSVMQVSGTVVTPMEGCATLFACLAQDEGGGGEKPTDGVEELCSFTSRTAVTTERGKRPIGTLRTGEKVLAYNPQTHKMEMQPILHMWINHDNDLVDLTLTTKTQHGEAITKTSETIHTNKKHPFLTVEKGFVRVDQLRVGMHVVRAGGGVGVITGWKLVPGVMTMYNLEVAQDHTFTVGAGQWVVHNCGATGPGQWVQENASMSDSSARYQSQVTGQDPGQAYQVNDVNFDGYRDGTLLEAKGPGYQSLFERMGGKPFFRGMDNLIAQARRQVAAAGDIPIEWHVAEEGAANVISNALQRYPSISVIWTPPIF